MENNNENTQKQKNEQDKTATVTRAEKSERMKTVIRELLAARPYKWNEFLDTSARVYAERFPEETGDDNAVKGRIGSTFDVMEKAGEVHFEANVCSLAAPAKIQPAAEVASAETKKAPAPKKSAEATSAKTAEEKEAAKTDPASEEKKSAPKKRAARPAAAEKSTQVGASSETVSEAQAKPVKAEEEKEEKAEPKKRGRKPKAEAKKEGGEEGNAEKKVEPKKRGRKPKTAENEVPKAETNAQDKPQAEPAAERAEQPAETVKTQRAEIAAAPETIEIAPKAAETAALTVKPEAKVAPVFDMTLLLGNKTEKKPSPAAKADEDKRAASPAGEKPAGKEEKAPAASAAQSAPPSVLSDGEKPAEKTASEKEKEERPAAAKAEVAPAPSLSAPIAVSAPRTAERQSEARPAANVALVKEVKALAKEAETPKETKKPVLPEFAFLGNAAAKGGSLAAVPAAKEKEARRPAPVAERTKPQTDAARPAEASPRAEQPKAQPQPQASAAVKTAETSMQNGRRDRRGRGRAQTPALPATPEDALKAEFLRRLRALGGDYFEYYSVYLLERYSLRNGRRLEGMSVSGGERDGGIDGEITLTDKFGFRETIYIQAKNWDPSKGKEELWVIGETLLQQFIGAVACRQAKEGSQHSRGIFVTTSHFTPEGKELLETMADKFVGYDGDDVFEAAKECSFGLKKEGGEWTLDEELLSGGKAFFNML